jgi:hypothetical protein
VAQIRELAQRQGRELTRLASRELDIMVMRLSGELHGAWPLVLEHIEELQGQPRLRGGAARLAALIALGREDWTAVAEYAEMSVQDLRQLDRRFLLPGPLFLRLLAWHRLGRTVEPALLREAAAATLEVDGTFAADIVVRSWSELRPQDGLGGRIPAGQWRQRLTDFLSHETPSPEGEVGALRPVE